MKRFFWRWYYGHFYGKWAEVSNQWLCPRNIISSVLLLIGIGIIILVSI